MPCLLKKAKRRNPRPGQKRYGLASGLTAAVRLVAGSLLDIILPPRCHSCLEPLSGETARCLCAACLDRVIYLTGPLCRCCGAELRTRPAAAQRFCVGCLVKPPRSDSIRSLVVYRPPVSRLLQDLKYRGDMAAAVALAGLAAGRENHLASSCDCIVPVPLTAKKLRRRGLNQSLVLAALIWPDQRRIIRRRVLVKTTETADQTTLTGPQRRANLRRAFAVQDEAMVSGKTVLLVDDVYTTGATIEACARALTDAGAAAVHGWTLARVEASRERSPAPWGAARSERRMAPNQLRNSAHPPAPRGGSAFDLSWKP